MTLLEVASRRGKLNLHVRLDHTPSPDQEVGFIRYVEGEEPCTGVIVFGPVAIITLPAQKNYDCCFYCYARNWLLDCGFVLGKEEEECESFETH